jgi:hypothetical protein
MMCVESFARDAFSQEPFGELLTALERFENQVTGK